MEILFNHYKYEDRILSDEEIKYRLDMNKVHETSMSEMMREHQYNERDKKAIEEHFEKTVW